VRTGQNGSWWCLNVQSCQTPNSQVCRLGCRARLPTLVLRRQQGFPGRKRLLGSLQLPPGRLQRAFLTRSPPSFDPSGYRPRRKGVVLAAAGILPIKPISGLARRAGADHLIKRIELSFSLSVDNTLQLEPLLASIFCELLGSHRTAVLLTCGHRIVATRAIFIVHDRRNRASPSASRMRPVS
jgi:hypothetical protein